MQKIRNFACLIYPESEVNGWKDKITEFGIPFYYIFHDKDDKKPHYHVFFCAVNAVSINTAKNIVKSIGGANGAVERVATRCGYLRYLTHMDNPDKYQYSPNEVICGCSAEYKGLETKTDKENSEFKSFCEMIEYIDANNVFLYCDFVKYCVNYKKNWLKLLCGNKGRVIDKYIKSLYWYMNNECCYSAHKKPSAPVQFKGAHCEIVKGCVSNRVSGLPLTIDTVSARITLAQGERKAGRAGVCYQIKTKPKGGESGGERERVFLATFHARLCLSGKGANEANGSGASEQKNERK